MNAPKPPDSPDPELSRLLRSWRIPSETPPGFQEAVWRRLDARPTVPVSAPWAWLMGWMEDRLRMPFAMPACLTILVLTGVVAGALHGRASSTALTAGLQVRYVQSIDPFASRLR